MGLYNFKRRFAPAIRSGLKRHTIRAKRAHPDKAGNTLHLYTGLRTKHAELIARVTCTGVQDISISEHQEVTIEGYSLAADECAELAKRDGFRGFRSMMKFWDGRLPFAGDIIHWKPLDPRGKR